MLPCDDTNQEHVALLYPFVGYRCHLTNDVKMSPAYGSKGYANNYSSLPLNLLKQVATYFKLETAGLDQVSLEMRIIEATKLPAWKWHTMVDSNAHQSLRSLLAMAYLPPYHKPKSTTQQQQQQLSPGYIHGFDIAATLARYTDSRTPKLIPPLAPERLPHPRNTLRSSRVASFKTLYGNRNMVGVLLNGGLSGKNNDVWTDWSDAWVGIIMDYNNAALFLYDPTGGNSVQDAVFSWVGVLLEEFQAELGKPVRFEYCEPANTYQSYTGWYVLLWMLSANGHGNVDASFSPLEEINAQNHSRYVETFFNFLDDDDDEDKEDNDDDQHMEELPPTSYAPPPKSTSASTSTSTTTTTASAHYASIPVPTNTV